MNIAASDANVAEIPHRVLLPIAQALVTAASRTDPSDFDQLPKAVQREFLIKAAQLLELVMPALTPRVRFNIQLVARIRELPDGAVIALTQQPINATRETRRLLIARALRIDASEDAPDQQRGVSEAVTERAL